MLRKYIFGILFLMLIFVPLYMVRAESSNVGFIPANIWYSKDPFVEGDKIKIYTLVFNPDPRELSGNVLFFDDTILLGKKSFIVPAHGVKDVSIDWTVTAGKHTIYGKIENAKFFISQEKYETVALDQNVTEKSTSTVQKKITVEGDESGTDGAENTTDLESDKTNIIDTIKERTPDFIAKPISSAFIATETFREKLSTTLEDKQVLLKAEIAQLEVDNASTDTTEKKSSMTKPLKSVELFFVSLFHFILDSKALFYIVSIFIIFLVIRYVFGLIF